MLVSGPAYVTSHYAPKTMAIAWLHSAALAVGWMLIANEPVQGIEFYVAVHGSDVNPGTKAAPFATFERARDAIRQYRRDGKYGMERVEVLIRGGIYPRQQPLVLSEQDSGSSHAPIVYGAYPGETVSISGGIELPLAEFTAVTDPAVLERVPEIARDTVRVFQLKKHGYHEYGQLSVYGASVMPPYTPGPNAPELIVNDQVMTLARWPNADYALVDTVIDSGANLRMWQADMVGRNDRRGVYVPPEKRENPPRGFAFTISDKRPQRWIGAEDAWLFGYWYWDWSDQSVQIKSIEPESNIIQTVHASGYSVRSKQRFFAFNLLEELDSPGEWYLDRKLGSLYFFPIDSTMPGSATLSLCTVPLVELRGASHVWLRDLKLGTTCGDAVHISQGSGNGIENCNLGNLGGKAVIIDGGSHHIVRNCWIHDTGSGGIRASGGDRQTLLAAGHRIENNEITRYSRLKRTCSEAIALDGVGCVAAGNHIHDAPHAAIHFLGNDHTIEFNEIHHVLQESDDAGAVYSGRRLTYWGNKIRHNYFHDVYGLPAGKTRFKRILAHAVYLDDALSGIEVTGNVFRNCNNAICVKGSDNRLDGNVIVDCRQSIVDHSKSDGGTHAQPLRFDQPDRLPANMDLTQLTDILSVPYTSQHWRERYPGLATSLEETFGAWRVSIQGNVLLRTPPIQASQRMQELGSVEGNLVLQDDYQYESDADLESWVESLPSRLTDFSPIPFSKIGLQNPIGPR